MYIEVLNINDFNKLSNIWDFKKHKKLAETCYNQMIDRTRIGFVARENDIFIGQVDLVFDNDDLDYTIPGKRIYLSRLIVKKENRRQGIGKALSEFAFQYAAEKGYSEISLGVDLDNFAAIKLY